MYAERKGWLLEDVEVRLSHARIHAEDCEDCETKEGMLGEIQSRIRLEGNLDQAQRKRLLEIATRCPRAPDALFRDQDPNDRRLADFEQWRQNCSRSKTFAGHQTTG